MKNLFNGIRWRIVIIVLALFCMIFSYELAKDSFIQGDHLYGNLIRIRMDHSPISKELVNDILQGEIDEDAGNRLSAWYQQNGVTLENRELGKNTMIDVAYYTGAGASPQDLNLGQGLALSIDQAYALWGTKDVIGETVFIEEKAYVVERLLYYVKNFAVAKTHKNTEPFTCLDLQWEGDTSIVNPGKQLADGYGLKADAILSYSSYLKAAQKAGTLPIWIWCVFLFVWFLRKAYGNKGHPLIQSAWIVLSCVIICCCYFVFGLPFDIPLSLIPTKWSDFSFWKEAISQMQGYLIQVNSMEQFVFDRQVNSMINHIFIWSLLSNLFLTIAVAVMIHEGRKEGADYGIHIIKKHCKKIFRHSDCGKEL